MSDETGNPDEMAAAAEWAARSIDPAFEDWIGLAQWLDGDPSRNRHYDEAVIAIEDGIAALVVAATPPARAAATGSGRAPPPRRTMRRRADAREYRGAAWRRWPGIAAAGAIAASIAGLVLMPSDQQAPKTEQATVMVLDVPAGTARRIGLPDGSRIDVAGGSRLAIDRANPRFARLERGRALFSVRHDEAAPFLVKAGPHDLMDAGTIFEVVRRPDRVRVSVAEGAVVVDPSGRPLTLEPGDRADLRDGTAERMVSRVAPDRIGRWTTARLTYRDAPLSEVADDLAGALGIAIDIAPELAARRFTGTLIPSSFRDRPDALAVLLNVRPYVHDDRWELRSR